MIIFSWVVLLYTPFIHASLSSLNDTCIPALEVCNSPSNVSTRTLWTIIWSCAATLFACTWTAIHPNIPGTDERKIAVVSRRLFIMLLALIAPELIITWATRQFLSVRQAANKFNDAFGATLPQTHGDDRNVEENTTISLGVIPESDGGNNTRSSAPRPAGQKFRGRLHAHTLRSVGA